VLVLQGGVVKQQILMLNQAADQDWLTTAANRLNDLLNDQTASQIQEAFQEMSAFDQQVTSLVIGAMDRHDSRRMGHLYRAGVEQILAQPEFSDAEGLRQMLRILEEHSVLAEILDEVREANGVQVFIGGEGRWSELSAVGLVLSRYGDAQQAAGVVGLVGPIRMPYARAISSVQYVSNLLTDLMYEFYLG
jgi:heat-inducible transcriptional repressor